MLFLYLKHKPEIVIMVASNPKNSCMKASSVIGICRSVGLYIVTIDPDTMELNHEFQLGKGASGTVWLATIESYNGKVKNIGNRDKANELITIIWSCR